MSDFYAGRDDQESMATIHRALDLGSNFLDTSAVYGLGQNEALIGQSIRGRRHHVVLATKCGAVHAPDGRSPGGVNGSPGHVKSSCEASLRRLGVDAIDLYYQHRVDPAVPIEDTVGAMADLVCAGKVRFLGLSEAAPQTLRRAHAVHPIAALQTEYSLWTRDVEAEILPVCRELGVGFVAYSPLGRGVLTGRFTSPDEFPAGDVRPMFPRHDTHHSQGHRRSWSDSSSYRDPSTGRYTNWVGHHRDGSLWEDGRKHRRYHKARPWLSYPEWEARRKALRRSWEQPQPFALEGTPGQDRP